MGRAMAPDSLMAGDGVRLGQVVHVYSRESIGFVDMRELRSYRAWHINFVEDTALVEEAVLHARTIVVRTRDDAAVVDPEGNRVR